MSDFFTHFSRVLDLTARDTIAWIDTNGWLAQTLAQAGGRRGVR